MKNMPSQDPHEYNLSNVNAAGKYTEASKPCDWDLIFCDTKEACLSALRSAFSDVPNVSFVSQPIQDLQNLPRPAAFCSAGNSFGMMDGGVDLAIREMLSAPGDSMQRRCRAAIHEKYLGEQPVGTCMLLPAPVTDVFDWLAYAPTMTVPEDCSGTRNPYLAFRGMLTAICQHNASAPDPIRSVVTTSLCTGYGRVSGENAAAQMRLAYAAIFEPQPVMGWPEIQSLQEELHVYIK